jgi:hypothetical protein
MKRARSSVGLVLAAAGIAAPALAERWRIQYFYDRDRETLHIGDLRCPTARRCIASATIDNEKGSRRPTVVVTSDGGAHWALVPLRETPISLFFLNESNGWMVGSRNLWRTIEGGRGWEKVGKLPQGTLRVAFLDEKHGFAVGLKKSVSETTDGGLDWKPVPAAAEPKTREEHTVYSWIEFVDPMNGIITGFSRPPRRDPLGLPDWVNPESAVERRQWPTVSITLDTHNAGATWSPSTGSFFGQISRVRLSPAGVGLGLISFMDNFEWPAEVFRVNWKTGKSGRVFRDKNRRITDVAVFSEKLGYLAGQEVLGQLHQSPIPGRLKMYKSTDLQEWKEMDVDYRANAAVALLAAADEQNIWVATDTGMILKLQP